MSEIAERANASIGSLYQFFPNKESIAYALHTQCGRDIERIWAPLLTRTTSLSIDQLLNRLIDATVHYIDTHPALVALQEAPRSSWNERLRRRLEQQIARFFLNNKPWLDKGTAEICGAVSLQIIRSCTQQYLQATKSKRSRIVSEYKFLLRCYGGSRRKAHKATHR